jgi:hypothetical protein
MQVKRKGWIACGVAAAVGMATSPAVAQPAPVQAGVWDVQTLVTVEPAPASGAASLSRRYRVCILAERARNPMWPRRLPQGAELVFDGQTYTGSYDEPETRPRQQVDISYRRLSATAFEGSRDAVSPARTVRLQYLAQHVGPHCGATRPSGPGENGEP